MRSRRCIVLGLLWFGVLYGLQAQGLTNTAFVYKKVGDTGIIFQSIEFSEDGEKVPTGELNIYIVFVNVGAGARKATTQSQVIAGTDGDGRSAARHKFLKAAHTAYVYYGLETATRYKIQMVAVKPNGAGMQDDVQSVIVERDFGTTDTRPPRLYLHSLGSRSVTGESVSFRFNLNEHGKVYYVVLAADATAPTSARDIKNRVGARGTVPTPIEVTRSKDRDHTAGGLDDGVSYVLYVVGADRSENFSEILNAPFTTLDTTPPTASLTLGTPTARSVRLSLRSDEDADYYWVVWREQETEQDDAATYNENGNNNGMYSHVVLGRRNPYYFDEDEFGDVDTSALFHGQGKVMSGQTSVVEVRELMPRTEYRAHVVLRDAARNTAGGHVREGVLSSEAFTTPEDKQAPMVSFELKSAEPNQAIVSLSSSEPATLYYLLLDEEAAAPDAATIKAPPEGARSGVERLMQSSEKDLRLSDLGADTGYKLYVVAVDLADLNSTVFDFSFRTQDNILPEFSTLEVEELSASTVRLSVRASEPATACYVILEESKSVPSKDEVRRQKGAQDSEPRQSGEVSVGTDEGVISVAGLSKNEYLIYVILKDEADNMSDMRVKYFDTGALVAGGSEKFSIKKTVEMQVQTMRQRVETSTFSVEREEHILMLYPNPTEQRLYIRSTEPIEKLVLRDAAGKSVLTQTFDVDERKGGRRVHIKNLSTSNLPKGSYVLLTTLRSGVRLTRRFVKK